jgi:oligopeptide transport system ATP-binding protein
MQSGGDPRNVLLRVADLRAEFFTENGIVRAVRGVSFDLREGEVLGIVGESGCGKSVTALSVMRLLPTPAGRIVGGRVEFDGRDLLGLSTGEMRRVRGNEIGMVFQDPMSSLNPALTIGLQIAEVLQLHRGLSRRAAAARAVELLELVGMPDASAQVGRYPHQLSGGMRQRTMIAMALSCEPRLLIADEATTALDVTIQAQILDLIRRLRDELGMAIMMITHDLGVVAGIADRINVMYAGHIVETGSVDQIFEDPRHPYTLGLLKSIPRIDGSRATPLIPIRGAPPGLISLPEGCAFQPRCDFSVARSAEADPPLIEVEPGHSVACWVDVRTGAPQELAAASA